MKTNNLIQEAIRRYDEQFPQKEGAYTFSGKRAKDFLEKELLSLASSIRNEMIEKIEGMDDNKPGEFGDGYEFALQDLLDNLRQAISTTL